MDNGRLLAMRLRDASANLLDEINRCLDGNKLPAMRTPELVETSARHILHREISTCAASRFKDVRVGDADDVRVFEVREQNRLAKHLLNLVEIHAHTLENLHGLPPKEAMPDAIDFGKRPLAQEAFHFVGVSDCLAVFEQAHIRGTWQHRNGSAQINNSKPKQGNPGAERTFVNTVCPISVHSLLATA